MLQMLLILVPPQEAQYLLIIYSKFSKSYSSREGFLPITGMLIRPYPDQEGNKLQRQKILSFIYTIYNKNWRNISTVYIYNKTSIKRNILTFKKYIRK